MKQSTRNIWLVLGIIWTIGWLLLWVFGPFGFWENSYWELPGILFIIIALVNWDTGSELNVKETRPAAIENRT
jgi:hypothetical protein